MNDYKKIEIPEKYFFDMATKEYSSWKTAFIREFIQNSIDAGASKITTSFKDGYFEIVDNGEGMNDQTIQESLLTLGGSKKHGKSVGGLGKAKEILYFSWPAWSIRSLYWKVDGKGGSYNLSKRKTKYKGTKSSVFLGDTFPDPGPYLTTYLPYCSLNTKVTFNNQTIRSGQKAKKGEAVTTIQGLGILYENEVTIKPQVIVQTHGLYMFSSFGPVDKSYIFEITQNSYDCLTANRNGFKGSWQDKFNQTLVNVAIDSHSAKLRKEQILTVKPNKVESSNLPLQEILDSDFGNMVADHLNTSKEDLTEGQIRDFMANHYPLLERTMDWINSTILQAEMKKLKATKLLSACMTWYSNKFEQGFVIVSEEKINSDLIRDLYSRDCLKTAVLWQQIVEEVGEVVGPALRKHKTPGLGFIISDRIEAQCYENYLLFNPYFVIELPWQEGAVKMVGLAVHEYVHFVGFKFHNEDFLIRYQEFMNEILSERLDLADHLNQIKKVRKNAV